MLREKAKAYGISPIQIQILLFVSKHRLDLCNVSYMAKEFSVTKPTVSDAVKVLIKKKFLIKDFSPIDNRRYNLALLNKGMSAIEDLNKYASPIISALTKLNDKDKAKLFESLTNIILELNQAGIILVQRFCYNCQFYEGDKKNNHFCNLLNEKLKGNEVRLDCNEFAIK